MFLFDDVIMGDEKTITVGEIEQRLKKNKWYNLSANVKAKCMWCEPYDWYPCLISNKLLISVAVRWFSMQWHNYPKHVKDMMIFWMLNNHNY